MNDAAEMPGDLDRDVERGRRVHAALVLRGTAPEDLARELNLTPQQLERIIAGDRALIKWETTRVAELLRIPDWFLLQGLERDSARDSGDDLLKAYEVARILSLSTATVVDRFERGDLPGFRLFGAKRGPLRFRRSEIDQTLEGWRAVP